HRPPGRMDDPLHRRPSVGEGDDPGAGRLRTDLHLDQAVAATLARRAAPHLRQRGGVSSSRPTRVGLPVSVAATARSLARRSAPGQLPSSSMRRDLHRPASPPTRGRPLNPHSWLTAAEFGPDRPLLRYYALNSLTLGPFF